MGPEWFFFQLTSTHISIPHSIPFHSHYQLVEIHQLFLLLLFHLFGLHSHCKSVRIMLAWRLDCLNGCNEGRCLYFTSTNYDRQSLPPTGQVWLSKSSFPLTTTFLFIGYEKKPFPFTIWPPRKKKPNCKYVKYCTRVWLCTHFVFLLFFDNNTLVCIGHRWRGDLQAVPGIRHHVQPGIIDAGYLGEFFSEVRAAWQEKKINLTLSVSKPALLVMKKIFHPQSVNYVKASISLFSNVDVHFQKDLLKIKHDHQNRQGCFAEQNVF